MLCFLPAALLDLHFVSCELPYLFSSFCLPHPVHSLFGSPHAHALPHHGPHLCLVTFLTFLVFSPDKKLICFTIPLLDSLLGSIWTAFADLRFGPCFSFFFLYITFVFVLVTFAVD